MFDWILSVLQSAGYAGLFFLMLLENVFPPIPSEVRSSVLSLFLSEPPWARSRSGVGIVMARTKEAGMNDKALLRRGLTGSVIAAICCFTPLLVVVFAGVGLSALVGRHQSPVRSGGCRTCTAQ